MTRVRCEVAHVGMGHIILMPLRGLELRDEGGWELLSFRSHWK
jgi:hypothetical protein